MATSTDHILPALRPRLGRAWSLRPGQLACCAWFSLWFLYLSYVPLFHSDIWGHVLLGREILAQQSIPTTDPYLPLAEGVPVVDTAWLAQVVFAAADRWAGPMGLSLVFASTVWLTHVVLARVFYLRSSSLAVALGGVGLVLAVGWSRHAIIRPEIFGSLLFAVLLWLITRADSDAGRVNPASRGSRAALWSLWLGVPVLFAVWANVHGSFPLGIIVLACYALGRGLEVLFQQRSLLAAVNDRGVRMWLVLTELALVATLVNPYGTELLAYTLRFSSNPNLKDVLEWYPLKRDDFEGWLFAGSIVLVMLVLRHSRLRIRPVEVLLVGVTGWLVAGTARMIGWYAFVLATVLAPHVAEIFRRLRHSAEVVELPEPSETDDEPRPRYALTLVAVLLVWSAFAFSPYSYAVLGGKPRPRSTMYSRQTPLALAEFLRTQPPHGLLLAPQWWSDWLCYSGPPGLKVFMTTNLHLAPKTVWSDYLRAATAAAGWEEVLERYRVEAIVADKELQTKLAQGVRRLPNWHVTYEDDLGVVAVRRRDGPGADAAAKQPKRAGAKP